MATSRDDFSIAVRSAFLKKGNKQKFSLLALIISSIILLSLESFDTKWLNLIRIGIKDLIYRGSFVASIPGNVISPMVDGVHNHLNVYEENKLLKFQLEKLKDQQNQIGYLKVENEKLRKVIDDSEYYSYKSIFSKVLIDKKSPYLKSVILNKGFNNKIKKGMPILKGPYFVGRITEVNYVSSRALFVNDLNSKVPVIIEPDGYQAIMSGTGKDFGQLEFLPKEHQTRIGNIVYTSGADGVFHSGIPIGKIDYFEGKMRVKFFSDLNQLYLVSIITSKSLKDAN